MCSRKKKCLHAPLSATSIKTRIETEKKPDVCYNVLLSLSATSIKTRIETSRSAAVLANDAL